MRILPDLQTMLTVMMAGKMNCVNVMGDTIAQFIKYQNNE